MSAVSTADAAALFADLAGSGNKKTQTHVPQEGAFQSILAQARAPMPAKASHPEAKGAANESTPEASADGKQLSTEPEGETASGEVKKPTGVAIAKSVPRTVGVNSPDVALINATTPKARPLQATGSTQTLSVQTEERSGSEKAIDVEVSVSVKTPRPRLAAAQVNTQVKTSSEEPPVSSDTPAAVTAKTPLQGMPEDSPEQKVQSVVATVAKPVAQRNDSAPVQQAQSRMSAQGATKADFISAKDDAQPAGVDGEVHVQPKGNRTVFKSAESDKPQRAPDMEPDLSQEKASHVSAAKTTPRTPTATENPVATSPAVETRSVIVGGKSDLDTVVAPVLAEPMQPAREAGTAPSLPSRQQRHASAAATAKQENATAPTSVKTGVPQLQEQPLAPSALSSSMSGAVKAIQVNTAAPTPEADSTPSSALAGQTSPMQKASVPDGEAAPKAEHHGKGEHRIRTTASAAHVVKTGTHAEVLKATAKTDGTAVTVSEGTAAASAGVPPATVNISPVQHAQVQLQTVQPMQNGTVVMPGELSSGGEQGSAEGGSHEAMPRQTQEMPVRNAQNFSMAIRVDDVVINARLRSESLRLMIDMDGMHGVHEKSLGGQIQTILNESGFKSYRLTIKERSRKVYDHAEQLHVAVGDAKGHAGFSVKA